MNEPGQPLDAAFDEYAANYDMALAQGLSVSGENKDFFARGRLVWLKECLRRHHFRPDSVMDYGCGTGTAIPLILDLLQPSSVVGLDISPKSIEVAQRTQPGARVRFHQFRDCPPAGQFDLVFCNGVFHHIPPANRAEAITYVYRSLRAGGLFALWENNPWNPGTRLVMRRIPFDRDAITLTGPETRRLLVAAGFEILRTDFLFIFPRPLKWLRGLEPLVTGLPLGAQYQVLARKP